MYCLEKFKPEVFNKLSIKEKKIAIEELTSSILEKLDMPPIDIYYSNEDDFKKVCGKFQNYPPCIIINSFFLDSKLTKGQISELIDLYKFIPYQLVHTVAHECHHYYQYNLINKMVQGEELTSDQKDLACLYFISLYEKLMKSYCKKKGIYIRDRLKSSDLYTYSPTEIASNKFAISFISELGDIDITDNYKYFLILSTISNFLSPNFNRESDEKEDAVIEHDLKVAITFLKHKNSTSGLPTKYLGIDEEELKTRVLRSRQKIYSEESLIQNIINKIHNK